MLVGGGTARGGAAPAERVDGMAEGAKQITESVSPSPLPVEVNGDVDHAYPVALAATRDGAEIIRPEFAGIISRTVAYVLDAVIVGIVAFSLTAGTRLVVTVIGFNGVLTRTSQTVLLAALPLLLAAYDVVFWGLTGRTPGMALVGVRVTGTAGRPVSWLSASIRAVVLAYVPIVALWCLVDRRHQGIHDKLARTVVVRTFPRILAPATPA